MTGVPSAVDQTAPSHGPSHFERESALKGQFSMGLNEAQQFLRTRLKCTPTHSLRAALDALMSTDTQLSPAMAPVERLICIAGREVVEWLETTVHVKNNAALSGPRIIIAHQDSPDADEKAVVVEARRSPSLLIWKVDDAYNRLAVHCIARVLQCPSFSRTCMVGSPQTGWSTERHTYIMHPNPLRRVSLRRTPYARHRRHRRTSSASTTSSTASTQPTRTPGPLASGLAHHSATLIYTPPVTETEATESPDDHDRAFSTDYSTDSDGTDASLDNGIA